MIKTFSLFVSFLFFFSEGVLAQNFKFAFLSDTHIGVKNADEDLRRTVADINTDTAVKFVVISGDITENGTDDEVVLTKAILSDLKIPFFLVTGNHDKNWSPTGGEAFTKSLGDGRFVFEYGGVLFIGTDSGPFVLHRSPGQVPRADILWMDSILAHSKKDIPIVYMNHYPQDSTQLNWFEAIDRLKTRNIQLILVGHKHMNHQYSFEGIPAIMGRSNLRAGDTVGGYNVVHFSNGKATFSEKKPFNKIKKAWGEVELHQSSLQL